MDRGALLRYYLGIVDDLYFNILDVNREWSDVFAKNIMKPSEFKKRILFLMLNK